MRSIWFTSDFHLGHFNIIRYCNRPLANVLAMDDAIVGGVNACVKSNDVLYFLGDFCLGRAEQVIAYRKRLACKTIHFVEGNHDKVVRTQQNLFASRSVLSEINVAKQKIVLCHYAALDFLAIFAGGFGASFLVALALSFAANSCLTVAEIASMSAL